MSAVDSLLRLFRLAFLTSLCGAVANAWAVPSVTQTVVAGGYEATCVLLSTGAVECWGNNAFGQLGGGSSGAATATRTAVSGLTDATAIAAGFSFFCALRSGGEVKCWGLNDVGQLGDSTGSNSASPVAVTGITSAASIAAGGAHACAVLADGGVRCWGENPNGQLGNGTTVSSNFPVSVSGISGATRVAAGQTHTCALIAGGAVRCWGGNNRGQLGNGTNTDSLSPVSVNGIVGASAIDAGIVHTCALVGDSVQCWGYNGDGQLGDGSIVDANLPVSVSGLSGVTQITAGRDHSCALAAGIPKCWGKNASYQLGDGTVTSRNIPVAVTGLTGMAKIDASWGEHTCAISDLSVVRCWGANLQSQTGGTTSAFVTQPTVVKANQSISFGTAPSLAYSGAAAVSVSATSGLPVTLASTTTSVCQVSSGTVSGLAVGQCTLIADQGGDDGYLPAPQASLSFSIVKASQTITFGTAPTVTFGGSGTITATSSAGLSLILAATTPTICELDGSVPTTVRGLAVGTCTISANQAGNGNYQAAPEVTQSFPVAAVVPGPPSLTAISPGDAQITLQFSAPASNGGAAITSYTGTCTPSGGGSAIANSGSSSPLVIVGLTNGTSYQCAVSATNSVGTGAASSGLTATPVLPLVNGQCGSTHNTAVITVPTTNLCSLGTAGQVNGSGPWSWTCVGSGGGSSAICTATLSVVDHYYANILSRVADTGGKAYWLSEVSRMSALGADPKETYIAMARYFFTSAEFTGRNLDDEGFVRNLYLTFFNRAADQGGLDFWKGQIALGLPRDMVMYYFMFSDEFNNFMTQNLGAGNQRAEIGAVIDYYRGAFGRLPDDGGLKYWVNRFRTAQCASNASGDVYTAAIDIASGFFGGQDYWANPAAITNQKYVADLYNALMRRSGDLNGFTYWVSALAANSPGHTQMRKSFIDTTEFAARVAAIVAQGCTTSFE